MASTQQVFIKYCLLLLFFICKSPILGNSLGSVLAWEVSHPWKRFKIGPESRPRTEGGMSSCSYSLLSFVFQSPLPQNFLFFSVVDPPSQYFRKLFLSQQVVMQKLLTFSYKHFLCRPLPYFFHLLLRFLMIPIY